MQSTRVRRRRNTSFKQAIILLALLIVIAIIATGLHRSGLPSELAAILNPDSHENFRNLEQLDSAGIAAAQRDISGFWTYAEGDTAASPVAKREYMELIANGMLWQINEWYVNTPSGERRKVTHVRTGYIKPDSYSPENGLYYCGTRIIRQFFIADGDTCYGQSQVDEPWLIAKRGDGALTVNRRGYVRYEGELQAFFPDGKLLDIIDDINMARCQAAASMEFMAKRTLTRTLLAVPFFARVQSVNELVQFYYKPMVFDEMARQFDPRGVPDVMDVRLTITAEGVVSDLRYRSGKLATKRFDDLATADMRGWLFPAVGDVNDDQVLNLKIGVK
ncbi:MAG: hypothetical protein FWC23_10715 [Chitinispirillia bacterium]|nr:hypothetical protein [Chitinispirillia bacterium]MCL2269639.1 hypothetical protein [Chitinispirillia bacterium]